MGLMMTVAERLFAEGFAFDFFQAVRLLQRIDPARKPVGRAGAPREEVVRIRAHLSLNFPASSVYEVLPAGEGGPTPLMAVTFMGLTGPSGILPRHYTELLLRLDREARGPERHALRAWLDLFNHRLVSLFYRAWEKYRFPLAYERGETFGAEPDPFTRCLFSFVGLGMRPLRGRLRVEKVVGEERPDVLARIDDLALLHYSGLLAQRHRPAVGLRALLADYFGLPLEVQQFRGQWLRLDASNRSRLGGANALLGVNLVAGERVWDVQSKVRLRLGALRRPRFDSFLPDRAPVAERKAFFLLCHLTRLYLGMDFDFDVQLVLCAADVPECRLDDRGGLGTRLGWNTWLCSGPAARDADDAVFEGATRTAVG
jgi:type VI secretion system protein ImpH